MKNIALITNFNITDKLNVAAAVLEKIENRAEKIFILENYKERIFRNRLHKSNFYYRPLNELYKDAEMAIVIGGDGSVLECMRHATPEGVLVLGINMGRIGYMSELEPNELGLLDRLFEGEYTVDERAMLSVEIVSSSGQVRFRGEALNEAVIANGAAARIIDLELSHGDEIVSTYRADGLVVATPTGSTAYSLSAGGPIVDPRLSCFCVTPVCPHSLLARPLVFSDTAQLSVKNVCVREKVLHLTLDGRITFDMYYGDSARVRRSATTAKLLRVKNNGFGSQIRLNKLL